MASAREKTPVTLRSLIAQHRRWYQTGGGHLRAVGAGFGRLVIEHPQKKLVVDDDWASGHTRSGSSVATAAARSV